MARTTTTALLTTAAAAIATSIAATIAAPISGPAAASVPRQADGAGPLLAPAVASVAAAAPAGRPSIRSLRVGRADEASDLERTTARTVTPDLDVVSELTPRTVRPFAMVGATWAPTRGLGDVVVQVRTRTSAGWGPWQELLADEDTRDIGRPGTEPMYVGESDAVALRVATGTGRAPQDLQLQTVDLGAPDAASPALAPAATASAASATTAVAPLAAADSSPTFTPMPSIITRSSWGASSGTSCDSPTVGSTTFGVALHHTAGSNSYSASQSRSIVRGIQSYHVRSRGWCDIGYNFLVDKYGQIFEGRRGGTDRTVRGAHAGDYKVNTYSMGVSMMGNFDTANVGSAMRASLVRLVGWRLGTFYRGAKGTWSANGKKYQVIFGHRDVLGTACPGRYGYAYLPTLRDDVASYVADYDSEIKRYAAELGRDFTGYPYASEYGNATKRKTFFQDMELYWKQDVGVFWVGGYIRLEYNHLGAHSGVLGFPTTNNTRTGNSMVSLQRYENGTVYRVQRGSTVQGLGIYGDIEDYYRELGEAEGRLGAPETRIYRKTGLTRARFDGGIITQYDGKEPEVAYR